jgi:hypothetical protein
MNGRLKGKRLLFLMVLILAACQPAPPAPLPAEPSVPPTLSPQSSPTATGLPTEQIIPTGTVAPEPTPLEGSTQPPAPDGSLTLMPVAQYGGSITAFAVENDLLFTAMGARLQIYNIADPAQPQPITGFFPLNTVASDLAVQDQMVYLVDLDGHLLVFHAQDPETIYVIAAFQNAGNSRLFVHGDWGFTTNDVCVNGSCKSELKLFSLQSLAEPQPFPEEGAYGPDLPVVSMLEVPMAVVNVFSDGEYAYIAHQNGVLVAALPDLTVNGQLSSEFANGAVYQAPYLYQAGWGFLQIADLADPANPQWIVPQNTAAYPNVGATSTLIGSTLYGFETMGEFGYCSSELRAVDLSNPIQPDAIALADTKPVLTCVSRMLGYQDLLIALDWNGLHMIDVSEPGFPRLVSSIRNQPGTVEVMTNAIGFGRSGTGMDNLMTLDLNDPSAVQALGPFPPQWIMRIVQNDNYLFIPAWEDGLHVVDIANPTAPASVAHITSEQMGGPGLDAAQWDNYLFVARAESGIGIFDVSQPDQPVLVGEYTPQPANDVFSRFSRVAAGDGYLIALDELWQDNSILGTLHVFDLSSAPMVESAAQFALEKPFLRSSLAADGKHTYFMGSSCQAVCEHQIQIINLDISTAPQLAASFEMPGEGYSLTLHEDYLLVSAGTAGLYAWNISDPGSPVLAAHVDTPGTVTGAAVENELLVLSDGDGGLLIYQMVK